MVIRFAVYSHCGLESRVAVAVLANTNCDRVSNPRECPSPTTRFCHAFQTRVRYVRRRRFLYASWGTECAVSPCLRTCVAVHMYDHALATCQLSSASTVSIDDVSPYLVRSRSGLFVFGFLFRFVFFCHNKLSISRILYVSPPSTPIFPYSL